MVVTDTYYKSLKKWESKSLLARIDSKQVELTEKFLLPNINNLINNVSEIRQKLDSYMYKQKKKYRRAGRLPLMSKLAKYPLGQCGEIRDWVFDTILKNSRDPDCQGLNALQKFRSKGGYVKAVWGIQKDKYFQNMIQAGNLTIDCANDTVDINKPSVEILPIAESRFREIKSFEDYADVLQRYDGFEVFPNVYIPQVAPHYPMIFIGKDGRISFEEGTGTLASRNILSLNQDTNTNFEMARKFIFESSFSKKRLPLDIEGIVSRHFVKKPWVKKLKNLWEYHPGGDEFLTECAFYRFENQFSNFEDELFKYEEPEELIEYLILLDNVKKSLEKSGNFKIPRKMFFKNSESGKILVPTHDYDLYNQR